MAIYEKQWNFTVVRAQMYPRRKRMYCTPMDIKSYDPINAQLSSHMDVLNIFIRMAMIMSGIGGGRRK
ncbi:hypothetical protein Q1695_003641 [Nippostrongylus brasiliensis]|nr:hypothetical protein Q1695_003641 [Nippostrongylus brasiliensis]